MTPEIKWRIEQIRRGEVPEGYQRAGAKIIPYNWGIRQIGEVCVVNPARPQMIPDIVSFLAMADVSEDAKIVRQKQIRCSEANNGFSCFCRGDILIAKITPCFENGKGAYTATLETSVGFGSTEFHVLRCRIDPEFIFFHTVSFEFRKRLEAEMTGTAGQKRVQAESIAKYRIAVPPIIEQQKIAAILTTQDKVIELKEKRLAEKQRQKKYLMQQLLTGRKRLPGFSGEWKTECLGNLFSERTETNCEDLEMLAITGTQGIIPRKELDLKDNSSDDKSKYLKVCVGDIGYNTMRMWQGVSAYSNYEGIVSPAYTILKPNSSVDAKYFAYLFKKQEVISLFYRFSQGLVDDTRNLKYENFKRIKVFYPPDIKEQAAIAEVLTAADREIDLLRQEIEQEKQKKKALMQLLLTGIVRVNV